MSGLPGSGKTTLGRNLAAALDLPLYDKDDYLVALFSEQGRQIQPELRSALSREADARLRHDVESTTRGAVIVSFWRRPELSTISGTPTAWLEALDPLIEVYCRCPPGIAAARFASRKRHPGHGDEKRDVQTLTTQFEALDRLGPLGVRTTLTVDTTGPVDAIALATEVRTA